MRPSVGRPPPNSDRKPSYPYPRRTSAEKEKGKTPATKAKKA